MKKIFLSLVLLTSLLLSNDLSWVDEQVNAIKPPRVGVSNATIQRITDPFIFLKKNATKKSASKKVSSTKKANKTKTSSTNLKKSISTSILKKRPVYSSSTFVLGMIINNSALINGKWKRVGDRVNKYKITKIAKSSVTLKQNSRVKVISLVTKNNNLKFKK